jgi:hypothetical protein
MKAPDKATSNARYSHFDYTLFCLLDGIQIVFRLNLFQKLIKYKSVDAAEHQDQVINYGVKHISALVVSSAGNTENLYRG